MLKRVEHSCKSESGAPMEDVVENDKFADRSSPIDIIVDALCLETALHVVT